MAQKLNEQKIEKVRQFIVAYQKESGKSPAFRVIEKGTGVKGIASVSRIVLYLERQGLIEKDHRGGIELPINLQTGKMSFAPLLGTVPCGEPEIALEDIETSFVLPDDYFGGGDKIILKAKGKSMINAGIHPSDLLIVEQRPEAYNNEIVIAMLEGSGEEPEATAKRFYISSDKKIITLHPENNEMEDMVYPAHQVRICGVVVGVMRSYRK